MSEQPQQDAPDLGPATDAAVGDDTAAFLLRGGRVEPATAGDEKTIETPDELGGTGGEQPGGAG